MSFRMRATARFRTGATNTTAETSKSAATAYQTIAARIPAATNTVRFARDDPETPPTMDEQIALARKAADKLGVPNAESKPMYRIGRNSHTGEAWAYVEWTWEGLR